MEWGSQFGTELSNSWFSSSGLGFLSVGFCAECFIPVRGSPVCCRRLAESNLHLHMPVACCPSPNPLPSPAVSKTLPDVLSGTESSSVRAIGLKGGYLLKLRVLKCSFGLDWAFQKVSWKDGKGSFLYSDHYLFVSWTVSPFPFF